MKDSKKSHASMPRRTFLQRSTAGCVGLASGFSLGTSTKSAFASGPAGESKSPSQTNALGYLEESRSVPIVKEADVVVVGGGISGLFAALTAGRMGVSTILIDRFGSLGGNLGPGYQVGGSAYGGFDAMLEGELPTVPREFWRRLEGLSSVNHRNYVDVSTRVSYLASKMAEEAGVELILSAYGCNPIVEDNVVKGIFVEGPSGRVAITARIVIDATGNASIAERAGARLIRYVSWDWTAFDDSPLEHDPQSSQRSDIPGRSKPEGALASELTLYDEAGIYMLIGNVDEREYNRFVKENDHLSDDDRAWMEQTWPGPYGLQWHTGMPNAFIPLLRKARDAGSEYNPLVEFKDEGIRIATHWTHFGIGQFGEHLLGGRAAIASGQIDMGDMDMVSLLEQKTRQLAFETVEFLKKDSPGFSQDSYLIFLSPFLGSRGGPCIEGEQTLTIDDWAANRRFDDVIFQTFRTKRQVESYAGEDWEPGLDVPYRMMLPKGFDNIFVVARGAAYIRRGHDGVGGMRGKPLMQALGQAGGAAAALCIKSGSSAQTLDIRKLQKELVQQGFNLGDAARLKELDLVG